MKISPEFTAEINNVTVLMLVSGHTLLGRVAERTLDSIYLLKIIHFLASIDEKQHVSLEFSSFTPVLCVYKPERPFPIKKIHILFEIEPGPPLIEQYVKATSRIVTASANEAAFLSKNKALPPGFTIAN